MKYIKTSAFFLIQIILCLFFLETFSFFFLKYSNNPLYRARRILTFDERFGWFQKPNLDTTFEEKQVFTDENGFRTNGNTTSPVQVLTLGPSSAFGWGVSGEETYTSIFGKQQGGFLNASGIGHSIHQGTLFWKNKFTELNPKYVLIAYGVNDLDKFRFFDSGSTSDEEYFSKPLKKGILDSIPTNFTNVLSLALNLAAHQASCEHLKETSVRVPWEKFESHLKQLVMEMRAKNITPIIINTAFYLKNPRAEFNVEMIERAYADASTLAKKDKCKEAHDALKLAKSWEPENILYQVNLFNQKLSEFARIEKLHLIDAFTLLKNQPEIMFYDPVHPSARGHQEIAGQISKAVVN